MRVIFCLPNSTQNYIISHLDYNIMDIQYMIVEFRFMYNLSGGIAQFTRVLFELPCYPQFELEIHIVEVSYFTNILFK